MSLSIQVLAATMNRKSPKKIFDTMNINNGVLVNQITDSKIQPPEDTRDKNRIIISKREKGLSRSRNEALLNATSDICLIADDDVRLGKGYERIIQKAYKNLSDADIIAFFVEDENKDLKRIKKPLEEGRVGLIRSMKIRSVQISFRRESILNAGITFNEKFGAGTDLYMGEENIFLAECIRNGLRVYSVPEKIGVLIDEGSTWFRGFDYDYLKVKGAVFREMSTFLWLFLIAQFAMRKKHLFSMGFLRMFKIMFLSAMRHPKNRTNR